MSIVWKKVKLGDICKKIDYGYTESASMKEIGPKFLRITDIQNDSINWSEVPYCKISDVEKNKYSLEIGDIVIARTGNSTGANAVIKEEIDAVFASYLIRYRIDRNKADPSYIGYCLRSQSWKSFVGSIKTGSAQGGANAKLFALFETFLPPIEEQIKISKTLNSIDNKIELLQSQNRTLEAIASTIFKEWFVKFEYPGSNRKINNLPDGWQIVPLKEVVNVSIGRTPPRMQTQWFSDVKKSNIPWCSIKDMGNCGVYPMRTSEYLTPEAVSKFNIIVLPTSVVILSFKLTVGRLCITAFPLATNEAIAHLQIKDTQTLFPEYLYLYLKNFNFETISSTSSIATAFNSEGVKNLEILLPSAEVLLKAKLVLQPIFQNILNNTKEIESLIELRDTLLPKLISGTLQIKDITN